MDLASNKKYGSIAVLDERYRPLIQKCFNGYYNIDSLGQLVQLLTFNDVLYWHEGLIGIRKIVSTQQNPQIQVITNAGVIPKIIQFATQIDYPQLQLEAVWILANICSGTSQQCKVVVNLGGLKLFVELLKCENPYIIYNAIWGIGNLAGDSPQFRDQILGQNTVQMIVQIANKYEDNDFKNHCCWVLSNIARCKPLPQYELIKEALILIYNTVLANKFKEESDLSEFLWTICYFSEKQSQIQLLFEMNFFPKLLQLCETKIITVLVSTIRIIGNISAGKDKHSQKLIEAGVLPVLGKLLCHRHKKVRKQVCSTISNLCVSNQIIISMENFINELLALFLNDINEVKRQICHIFINLLKNAQPSSIYYLCKEKEIIKYFVELLRNSGNKESNGYDTKTLGIVLNCIDLLVNHGQQNKIDGKNIFASEFLRFEVHVMLQSLQYQEKIGEKAKAILTKILAASFNDKNTLI